MAYKLIVSPRAQTEIEEAFDYYASNSELAPLNFISAVRNVYGVLEKVPTYFSIRYKNVRALKLPKFPYLLYYSVNEKTKTIKILSCFQSNQNSRKRPK